jgi:hypothetical protein
VVETGGAAISRLPGQPHGRGFGLPGPAAGLRGGDQGRYRVASLGGW